MPLRPTKLKRLNGNRIQLMESQTDTDKKMTPEPPDQANGSRLRRLLKLPAFWPISGLALCVLAALSIWLGPPVYQKLKYYRAEQLISNAEQALQLDNQSWAFQAAQASLSLRSGNYRALRIIAIVLARTDSVQALTLLQQLMNHEAATPDDISLYKKQALRLALLFNRPDLASSLLPHSSDEAESTDDEYAELVARFHQNYGLASDAIPWISRSIQLRNNPTSSNEFDLQKRIDLIQLALQQNSATGGRLQFRNLLWDLTFQTNPPSLESARLLAASGDLSNDDVQVLINLFEQHPEAGFQDKLTAVDLKLQRNPEEEKRILTDTLYRFGSALAAETAETTASLGAKQQIQLPVAEPSTQEMELDRRIRLARWLNRHGEGERVSRLFALNEAYENQDVALVILDGLAQAGKWKEVEALLSDKNLKLELILRDLYLARASGELGYKTSYELSWDTIESTAIDRPRGFWYVAEYARVMGEYRRAETLYRRLLEFPSVRWKSYLALIQIGEMRGATADLLSIIQEMRGDFPDNNSIENDWAYLSALLDQSIPEALKTARQLVSNYPKLPAHHVTLALCLLKSGNHAEALEALDQIGLDWTLALEGWKAIRINLLKSANRLQEAQALEATLNRDSLKPEELELLE